MHRLQNDELVINRLFACQKPFSEVALKDVRADLTKLLRN
jgi:hypothetical protein